MNQQPLFPDWIRAALQSRGLEPPPCTGRPLPRLRCCGTCDGCVESAGMLGEVEREEEEREEAESD